MKYLLLGMLFIFPLIVISKPVNQLENHQQLNQQQLMKDLEDLNPNVRRGAIRSLKGITPIDLTIQKQLAEIALFDRDTDTRIAAINALIYIQPTDPNIHKTLANNLTDVNPKIRKITARALGVIQPKDPSIHKMLANVLADKDPKLRIKIAETLAAIQPTDPVVHKQLARALNDEDSRVQQAIVLALIYSHQLDPTTRKKITEILEDSDDIIWDIDLNLTKDKLLDSAACKQIMEALTGQNIFASRIAIKALSVFPFTDSIIQQQLQKIVPDLSQVEKVLVKKALNNFRSPPNETSPCPKTF